jgi:hypothetical protein
MKSAKLLKKSKSAKSAKTVKKEHTIDSPAIGKKAEKSKKVKKKAKLAKERRLEIERGMSVTQDTRRSSVKKKKKSSIAEDTEKLKRKKVSIPDEDDVEDEDEDFVGRASESIDADDGDDEGYEEDDNEGAELIHVIDQLAKCDPGPAVTADTPCGFNCGSCDKFVPLNDPRREDSEWLTAQLNRKAATRCPFLFPEELEIAEGKTINDYVMRADTKACDKFRFNENRAGEQLKLVIDTMRKYITADELQILQFQIEQTRKLKAVSADNGYSLGERVQLNIPVKGIPKLITCEVIDFQRKKGAEVVVRPITHHEGLAKRYAMPARRITAAEED